MRLRLPALVLALGLVPGVASARPASLAVRPASPAPLPAPTTSPDRESRVAAVERLATAIAALSPAPVAIHSLLDNGSGPIAIASKAATGAAVRRAAAMAPTGSRALGDWLVLDFEDAVARDAAAAVLTLRGDLVVEAVRVVPLAVVRDDRARAQSPTARAAQAEIPPNVHQVRAPEALALVTPDSSILVAVIDTGADLEHPDLVRRLWHNDDPAGNATPADDTHDQNGDGTVEAWERDDDDDNGYVDDEHGFDFTDAPAYDAIGDGLDRDADPSDDEGHGTHIAGIIAADGTLRGVAPFVQLMPVRAAFTTAFGGVLETDDAAAAIVYAVDNGARILNLSWGDIEESVLVREAVAHAVRQGVLVVAAAGNGGSNVAHWPSGEPAVLAVGSVDGDDRRSSFSNHGPSVPLYAPGELFAGFGGGIVSLAIGGGYASLRGTSMAAPHVAGVAALVMSRADRPDAARTRLLLLEGGRRTGSEDWSAEFGHGVVDAVGSVGARTDVVLQIDGPPRPFSLGRLQLHGTIAGGDLARWRADARPLDGGAEHEIQPWSPLRVYADTLIDVGAEFLSSLADGAYDLAVAAETGAGTRREAHVAFRLDRTAPRPDTLFALGAWRGAEARWLFSMAADEEVAVAIEAPPLRLSDPGWSRRLQIENAAGEATATWAVTLQNVAGLQYDTTFVAPPRLRDWSQSSRLTRQDASAAFHPESLAGPGPAGATLVWGAGRVGDSLTTAQAWGASAGRLVLLHDTGRAGRPAGFADTNGDGAGDLLLQNRSSMTWLVTRRAGTFPDSIAAVRSAERALGLFQLDTDAPAEAILSSRDSLYLYDDAAGRPPALIQVLPNLNRGGFNVFGADAAVGDLDADGQLEIACGDAEGNVSLYERSAAGRWESQTVFDTQGTYSYDLSPLPANGWIVGRQRTRSVTGDGFPTTAYEFLEYRPTATSYQLATTFPFLAPENDLAAGSTATTSPATGDGWLALVRGADLYLLRGANAAQGPFQLDTHQTGAAGEAPALVDLDADGSLDLVLRAPEGATWLRLEESEIGPHDLRSESLGADRLRLTWSAGDADTVRVLRRSGSVWAAIGTTVDTTWTDSGLVPFTSYAYQVEALRAGLPGGASNVIEARTQPLPRLITLAPLGGASVQVTCTNPLSEAAREPHRWTVVAPSGVAVVAVTLSRGGREATLVLSQLVGCDSVKIRALDVRDEQGGRLVGAAASAGTALVCEPPTFAVARAYFESDAILVEFTQPVDGASLTPARFHVEWNTVPLEVARAVRTTPTLVRLEFEGVEFVGRGIPYRLRIDPTVRGLEGQPLAFSSTEYLLRVAGLGARHVFPAPNPVRPDDARVTFAEAAADTRIEIFTLEGDRVRILESSVGGGIDWDLRDASGGKVASGAYLYCARDATGSHCGRLVLIR